jgi:flavin reductase (DIM6/NTAB) family NADH-FMN oxidoreductase RutF
LDIDPKDLSRRENYAFLISAIVPRPIAFVSTVGRDGVLNLAPFSFFMGVTSDLPILAVSVGRRKGALKDTARNIADTRQFTVNIVDEDVADAMVRTSGDYPPDADEFDIAGLTPVPSDRIRPPRVGECKVSLECAEILSISVGRGKSRLILGEVLVAHVDDSILEGRIIDPRKLKPVGRLGGASYCKVRDIFERSRPKVPPAP